VSSAAETTASGYLRRFEIKRVFDVPDRFRVDVEIELASHWSEPSTGTLLKFAGATGVQIGDREGIDLGSILFLAIRDVSERQWDGIRYEVSQVEQGCHLQLCCQSFEIGHR
jgi:hypothetical protein